MSGRLFLMPNTLDFGIRPADGTDLPDLRLVLPQGVLERAAGLHYWVVENAKTTRAFLKRVDPWVPLAVALQDLHIVELPRPPKGGHAPPQLGVDPWHALLRPALDGHDVGLQSEAGLPAIADPGAPLVRAAHAAGISVVPLSGPSSLMLALSASGLDGQRFAFVGYLPVRADERTARLRQLEAQSRQDAQTQVLIETPYRNAALSAALIDTLRDTTRLSIACGLTLPAGWVRTATVAAWKAKRPSLPDDIPAVFSFLASR